MANNQYLANQFSGELVQLLINTICDEWNINDQIADYYYNINIDNALAYDLYNIGLLIGLPWPSAPASTFDGTAFIFGTVDTFPVIDYQQGFGTISDLTIGGLWTSVTPTDVDLIPINFYRSLLKAFAFAKYNGITIHTIDVLAKVFSEDYLIGYSNLFTFGAGDDPEYAPFTGFSTDGGGIGGILGPDSMPSVTTGDIHLIFLTNIGPGNLYVIQKVFDVLCTTPKVICSIGV